MLILQVSFVMFVATAIRSAFGFGEALIAVPILSLIIPIELAAPVAIIASIIISAAIICRDWRHIHFVSARRLIISTLFGIPIGLLLLKTVPAPIIKCLLGLMVLSYSVFYLTNHKRGSLTHDRFAWIFGFFAGVFGGTYGMNGPPLAIYGSLRGWEPAQFRATLQGYFLPASLIGFIGFGIAHLWTHAMVHLSLWSLPAVLIGIPVGEFIHTRLDQRHFLKLINIALALIGLALLIQPFL